MKISDLIKTGIPIKKAQFHAAVNNGENVPENAFSSESNSPSRRVKMWWTPHGLICFHKEEYFIVPLATVIFANFEKEIQEIPECDMGPIKEALETMDAHAIASKDLAAKKRGRPFKTKETTEA